MMNKFKIGDVVVCVDADPVEGKPVLEVGKEYTITDVQHTHFLSLDGVEGGYYGYRFERAQSKEELT